MFSLFLSSLHFNKIYAETLNHFPPVFPLIIFCLFFCFPAMRSFLITHENVPKCNLLSIFRAKRKMFPVHLSVSKNTLRCSFFCRSWLGAGWSLCNQAEGWKTHHKPPTTVIVWQTHLSRWVSPCSLIQSRPCVIDSLMDYSATWRTSGKLQKAAVVCQWGGGGGLRSGRMRGGEEEEEEEVGDASCRSGMTVCDWRSWFIIQQPHGQQGYISWITPAQQ